MAETWTVLKVLRWTAEYFAERGITGGRLDAELLLCDGLGLDRVGLYLNYDRPLTAAELKAFRGKVARRARREPLQYILGEAEFWSLPFKVGPGVLVPRPETETLVEEALKRAAPPFQMLDVGTGSGAIAVALARELSEARVVGIDNSPQALALAAENVRCNGVEDRVTLLEHDFQKQGLPGGPFDLVLSNPPYVPKGDLAGLMPEVRDFEPRQALCGGVDGLQFYRLLIPAAAGCLKPGGWVLFEVGIHQAPEVLALFEQTGDFVDTFAARDAAGIERVVGGKRR
jgi:release factor glutamine methyltransferase